MTMEENKFGPAAAAFMEQLTDEFPSESVLQGFGIIAAIDHGDGNSSVKFTFQTGDGGPLSVYMARGLIAETDRIISKVTGESETD